MAKTEGSDIDRYMVASQFTIELQNGITANFKEATGMNVELEVVESVDNWSGDTLIRKRPGTAKYGEITLKRTLSPDKSFWLWAKDIFEGKIERSSGALVMHDHAKNPIGRWTFQQAWPSKWSASDLDAGSDDLMIEEVTLQIEYITREQ